MMWSLQCRDAECRQEYPARTSKAYYCSFLAVVCFVHCHGGDGDKEFCSRNNALLNRRSIIGVVLYQQRLSNQEIQLLESIYLQLPSHRGTYVTVNS
jgi:hypothetical protein